MTKKVQSVAIGSWGKSCLVNWNLGIFTVRH